MFKQMLAVFNFKENLKGLTTTQKVISILYFPGIAVLWWGRCIKKYWKN